jgi:hypothetical protein
MVNPPANFAVVLAVAGTVRVTTLGGVSACTAAVQTAASRVALTNCLVNLVIEVWLRSLARG